MISRAHRIRLHPTKSQIEYLELCCLLRRKAYNWAYDVWNEQYDRHLADNTVEKPSLKFLSKQFTALRQALPDSRFNHVYRSIGERGIKDLCTSWGNYFKGLKNGRRTGRPKPAKAGVNERFYVHNSTIKLNGDKLRIDPQVGWIRMRECLRFSGKIMSGNITTKNGKWYISIQVQIPYDIGQHPNPGSSIGLDLGAESSGTTNLVVTSDSKFYTYPASIPKLDKSIRRAQRKLSRMWCGKPPKGGKALRNEKGQLLPKSNRYRKQTAKVAKLYERLVNIRTNQLHHVSTDIANNHECVYVENLNVANMTRRRRGKGKSAKSALNKTILNSCMAEIRRQLEYKTETCGGCVKAVDPAYTSQTCPKCGLVSSENRPTRSKFLCCQCAFEEHADVVAAINVFKRGTAAHAGN